MKQFCFLIFCLIASTRISCSEQQEKTLEDVKALCGKVIEAIGPLALAMETIEKANQKTTATKLAALTLQTALETVTKNLQDLEKEAKKIVFPLTKL